MGFMVLDDRSARLEVSLFPEAFEKYGRLMVKDELVVVEGEVQTDDFSGGLSLRVEKVLTMAQARQKFSDGVVMDFSQSAMPDDFCPRLKSVLDSHRQQAAGCPVVVVYEVNSALARISLGPEWQVQASDDLLLTLNREFGSCVRLEYDAGVSAG